MYHCLQTTIIITTLLYVPFWAVSGERARLRWAVMWAVLWYLWRVRWPDVRVHELQRKVNRSGLDSGIVCDQPSSVSQENRFSNPPPPHLPALLAASGWWALQSFGWNTHTQNRTKTQQQNAVVLQDSHVKDLIVTWKNLAECVFFKIVRTINFGRLKGSTVS